MPQEPSAEIASLIDKISGFKDSAGGVYNDEAARAEVLDASRKLTSRLEKPGDVPLQVTFLPTHTMCVRVAIDLKLFDLIAQSQSTSTITAAELAEKCGAEKLLIVRLMRVLVEIGFASETDIETYAATPMTIEMTKPASKAAVIHMYDQMMIPLAKMPEYLKSTGYKLPADSESGPSQYAFGFDGPTWDFWASQPGVLEGFNTFMTGVRGARESWVNWFPIEEQLVQGAVSDENAVFMVDVAGGRGHNLAEVKAGFPKAPGRFVLQDLPSVIDDDVDDLDAKIERMGLDMFDTQPIKGARIYFFHFIFHDWANAECKLILQNTAAAMEKGYSKLIIGDYILPDKGCPLMAAGADLAMLAFHSGMERSERQWRDLLDSCGLEVIGFWPPPGNGDGIVEAMLKA